MRHESEPPSTPPSLPDHSLSRDDSVKCFFGEGGKWAWGVCRKRWVGGKAENEIYKRMLGKLQGSLKGVGRGVKKRKKQNDVSKILIKNRQLLI